METTGQRLKARRKQLGLTALELANRIGVRETTIYRYESEDIRPSELAKRALAGALDVPVSDLFPPLEPEEASA